MTSATPAHIRVALITDLVDSTRLVAAVGDAAAHELFTGHDRLARDLLARFGGTEIDKSDGFLLLFPHPAAAVNFALAYHQALRQLSIDTGHQWRARVGIQLGQLFLHENTADDIANGAKPLEVEGLAKVVAARLMALAQGGQTLLGAAAFELAQSAEVGVPGETLGWLAHGRYRIKGLDEPLAVYEVGALGQAPLAPPPDSDKARRDITEDERETLGWRPGPELLVPSRPHWRLRRKLGAGGFGEAWLAEHDDSAAQQVFKFCHDPDRLRSLKREVTVFRLLREALGDRPDIARIIDWQFDQAPFFIESEYIAGGDLLAWADAQGGLAQAPIQQRLAIAAQIAEALGAAHSVGVLHKDIKPGNVLIRTDPSGQPWAVLTDFGIGMVTDRSQLLARGITAVGLTELWDGTPTAGSQLYMAPELLEGKAATVQADLYALGVMLYELAAGEFKPLAPGWQRDISCELLAQDIADLVDGDPSRRSSSAARVARELRALPERRAQLAAERQAQAVAEANRRALATSKRRWRWAFGLAAALIGVSLAVGYSAYQAALARDDAELRRGQAERLVGFMLNDLREKLTQVGRLDVMDTVTQEALDYFESIPTERLDNADLSARAKALYQIGDTRLARSDFDGAARAMSESLALASALAERAPEDPQLQFDLAQSHYWLGAVEFRRGNTDAAMTEFQRYQQIAQWLVGQDPQRSEWQAELGYAFSNLGTVLEAKGDYAGAVQNYEKQAEVLTLRKRVSPNDASVHKDIAITRNKLGRALEALHQLPEALGHYHAEQAILLPLFTANPKDAGIVRQLATSRYYSARLRFSLGDAASAASDIEASTRLLGTLVDRDPANTRWRRDLVFALGLAAQIASQRGSAEAASGNALRARALAQPIEATFPEIQPTLAILEAQLAFARGDAVAAAAWASNAIQALDAQPAEAFAGIRDEFLADAQLWQRRADANSVDPTALDQTLQALQARQPPSTRNLALQARLLLALGRTVQAQTLITPLLASGYGHWQLLADAEAAGIAIARSPSTATPNPP